MPQENETPRRYSDNDFQELKEGVKALRIDLDVHLEKFGDHLENFEMYSQKNSQYLTVCDQRFQNVQLEIKILKEQSSQNKNDVAEIKQDTKEILSIVNSLRGFFKVSSWVQSGLSWLIKWGAIFGALWLFITNGAKWLAKYWPFT